MQVHTTGSWPARSDRRAALVWLAIFWIIVGVGFGFDLHNYFHEQPPVPFIVHVHAIATTLWLLVVTTLIFMVETGNVKMHRTFGWFVAGYAPVVVFIAVWAELSWQALNLHTPGALPPQFLSIAFSGPLCLCPSAALRNSAAPQLGRAPACPHPGRHLHQRCRLLKNGESVSAHPCHLSGHLPLL